MAKLSNEALVYTSAYGARDPIKTAAGVTESFHKGSDFGPVPRGKKGVVLCAVYAGRATWLGDQYGALGVRITATATAAQAELLQRLYRRGRTGSTMQFDVWHVEKRLAARGSDVGAGAAIAVMGTTGRSTGIHTHAEFRIEGVVVDPKPFIDAQATRGVEDAPADYYGEGFLMALTADEQREVLDFIRSIKATNDSVRTEQVEEDGIAQAVLATVKVIDRRLAEVRDGQLAPGKRWTLDQEIVQIVRGIAANPAQPVDLAAIEASIERAVGQPQVVITDEVLQQIVAAARDGAEDGVRALEFVTVVR